MRLMSGLTTCKSCMMMDAEMYGMTPSANTETLERPPPENISNRLKSVPCILSKKEARADAFTPGIGTWTPIR